MEYSVEIDVNLLGSNAGDIIIKGYSLGKNEIEPIIRNHVNYMASAVFGYDYGDDELIDDCSFESIKCKGPTIFSKLIHFECGHIRIRWLGWDE